MYIHLHGDVVV